MFALTAAPKRNCGVLDGTLAQRAQRESLRVFGSSSQLERLNRRSTGAVRGG